jgi:hypothetical protein
MGKPEGKRPLEKPRCGWVDKSNMDLGERGRGHMDWIDLAHNDQWRAVVKTVMNLWVK